ALLAPSRCLLPPWIGAAHLFSRPILRGTVTSPVPPLVEVTGQAMGRPQHFGHPSSRANRGRKSASRDRRPGAGGPSPTKEVCNETSMGNAGSDHGPAVARRR